MEDLHILGTYIYNVISKRDTNYPVFYSNIDWHSSVHAHLTLLLCGYFLGNNEWIDIVLEKLTSVGIMEEAKLLKSDFYFEMPYGRAWLLLLTFFANKILGHNLYYLNKFADEVYISLRKYLQTISCNISLFYNYTDLSFLLFSMLLYDSHLRKTAILNLSQSPVKGLQLGFASANFSNCKVNNLSYYTDQLQPRFLSQKGMYLLLSCLLSFDYKENEDIIPVNPTNMYHYGVNYNRVLTFNCLYFRTNNQQYLKLVAEHLNFMKQYIPTIVNPNNYSTIGHWVPQFAVLAYLSSHKDFNSMIYLH